MSSDINTNVRLFDLVRYMRSELHEAELITEQEYGWLCAEAPMAKGQGSPSPRRLEDYDEIRARMKRMESALKSIAAHDGPGFPHGTCAKIAAEGLESENDQREGPPTKDSNEANK